MIRVTRLMASSRDTPDGLQLLEKVGLLGLGKLALRLVFGGLFRLH